MTVSEMRDGWLDLMGRLYDAESYFAAVRRPVHRRQDFPWRAPRWTWLRRHRPLRYLEIQALTILGGLGDARAASGPIRGRGPYRPVYARYLRKLLVSGRPPRYLFQFAWKCIMHTHFAIMTRQMVRGESRLVNS